MKIQKGNIVRIRKDLRIGQKYGTPPIRLEYDMAQELGKVGTVAGIIDAENAVKVRGWWWSAAMVENLSGIRKIQERIKKRRKKAWRKR